MKVTTIQKKLTAEIVLDYENMGRYLKLVTMNGLWKELSRRFRIVKRIAFSVKNVSIPGFIVVLTREFRYYKVYNNKWVDKEIIEYLKTQFNADAVILLAADNDYADVLTELKKRGKYIVVIGHVIARKLLEVADEYWALHPSCPIFIRIK